MILMRFQWFSWDFNDSHEISMILMRFQWYSWDFNDSNDISMILMRFQWSSWDFNDSHDISMILMRFQWYSWYFNDSHAIPRYPTISFVVLSCPTLLYISLCYPTLSYSPTTLLIFPQRCKPRRLQQKDNTILRYLTLFSMEPTCNDAPELVEDFFATGSISERFPFPRASPGLKPPRASLSGAADDGKRRSL